MSRISIRSRFAAAAAAVALVGGAALATASPASGAAGGATIIRTDETGAVVVCDDGVLTVTSGVFKVVVHETLTPSGAYHLGVEGNAQGVKAVAPTGATYQLPGGFRMEINATPGATVQNETDIFNVSRPGERTQFHCPGRHSHDRQRERQRHRLRRPPHRNRELHSLIASTSPSPKRAGHVQRGRQLPPQAPGRSAAQKHRTTNRNTPCACT